MVKKSEKRAYVSFKFDFDEFYGFCLEYYRQFGHLDVVEKCIVVKTDDGLEFIKRPTPEENAQKIYNFGEKFRIARMVMNGGEVSVKYTFTQDQLAKLTALDPDWRYSGASEFNEFYEYCKMYKQQFGDLNIPLKHVVLREQDGSEHFGNLFGLDVSERDKVVYYLGRRLQDFAARRDRLSKRNQFLIDRQVARLNALDPHWNYPRDYLGFRLDPITGKRIEEETFKAKQPFLRGSVSLFDFDKLYSYLLLYKTKYDSMNIHQNCVVVIRDGKVEFMRKELAKIENLEIDMFVGRFLKEVIYFQNNPDCGKNSIKHLNPDQIKKLDELCPGWNSATKSKLGIDYVSLEWDEYRVKHGLKAVPSKGGKRGKTAKKPKVEKEEVNLESEYVADDYEERAKKTTLKSRDIKSFNFELFYELCKHQKEVTSNLDFSRANVVFIKNALGEDVEYPIGALFHAASQTLYCAEEKKKGNILPPPDHPLTLTSEQYAMMAALESYWYLPRKMKTDIRVAEITAQRRARVEEKRKNMEM